MRGVPDPERMMCESCRADSREPDIPLSMEATRDPSERVYTISILADHEVSEEQLAEKNVACGL